VVVAPRSAAATAAIAPSSLAGGIPRDFQMSAPVEVSSADASCRPATAAVEGRDADGCSEGAHNKVG